MSDLMQTLEYVRTHLDDVLCTTKNSFDNPLLKEGKLLQKLKQAKLRVNVKRSRFALHEIKYLGYLLIRDGVKPQPEKVTAILDLKEPTSVKTLGSFLDMVQCYRDIWRHRSHMVAPLTDLIAECSVTKTTKAKGTKKKMAVGPSTLSSV